jgi:hypothetical protein
MKVAISRAELVILILFIVLGMGVWVWIDREITALLKPEEPIENQIQEQLGISNLQTDLTNAQEEQKAVQEQLVQARLDLASHTALLDALTTVYPQLTKVRPEALVTTTAIISPGIPLKSAQEFLDARVKQEAARRLADGLNARSTSLQQNVVQALDKLQTTQQSARQQFHQAQAMYLLKKPGLTLAAALGTMLILTLLIGIVHSIASRGSAASDRKMPRPLLILGIVGPLIILFGYQAFEIAGAAFASIVALLLFLPQLLRPA